jgi:hypothetical protein
MLVIKSVIVVSAARHILAIIKSRLFRYIDRPGMHNI